MTYQLVRYEPRHRELLRPLETRLWSHDPGLNAAYFRWKYEENPYLREVMLYLALHEGRAVGMRGMLGTDWREGASQRRLRALIACDLAVLPEHEGRSLPARIMRFAEQDARLAGWSCLLNLSAGPATYLHSIRSGWRDVGSVAPMRRQSFAGSTLSRLRHHVHAHRFFAPLRRHLARAAERRTDLAAQTAARRFAALDAHKGSSGPVAVGTEPRPAAMAALVASAQAPDRVHQHRDETYFAWRFRNPLSQYRFLYRGDGQLDGYLVLETPLRALQGRVRLVEWQAANVEVLAELLEAAVEWGRFGDLRTWTATLPGDEVRLFERCGFATPAEQARRYRRALLVRPLTESAEGMAAAKLDGWELRMACSDKC